MSFRTFRLLSVRQYGTPQIGWTMRVQSQSFVMVGTFLRTISVIPRVCFARYVVRNINILEQNALTMKYLQSFWNARVHPGSVMSPSILSITSSFKSSMKVSDSGSLAGHIAVTKTQRPRSEWHVGRHGRKAWLKDVAEWRGLGVAGKRGRKAWLKGVVLTRACRIEDVSLSVTKVGLPE